MPIATLKITPHRGGGTFNLVMEITSSGWGGPIRTWKTAGGGGLMAQSGYWSAQPVSGQYRMVCRPTQPPGPELLYLLGFPENFGLAGLLLPGVGAKGSGEFLQSHVGLSWEVAPAVVRVGG